jgi:hypothetical protein
MNSLTISPTAGPLHARTRERNALSVTPDIGARTRLFAVLSVPIRSGARGSMIGAVRLP